MPVITTDGVLTIAVIAKMLELSAHVCILFADYDVIFFMYPNPQ